MGRQRAERTLRTVILDLLLNPSENSGTRLKYPKNVFINLDSQILRGITLFLSSWNPS